MDTVTGGIYYELPNYFVCHCCFVLHKFDGSKCSTVLNSPYGWVNAIRCAEKHKHAVIIHGLSRTNYIFYFFIQLHMRRFYYSPNLGISTESLSYTEVQEYDNSVTLFSLEAQVCPGGERLSCASTHPGLLTSQGSLETPSPPIFLEETQYLGEEYLQRSTPSALPNLCLRFQDIMLLVHNQPYLLSPGGTSFVSRRPSCICVHLS